MNPSQAAAMVAAALIGLPAGAQTALSQPSSPAVIQQQLQEELASENVYKAWFPNLQVARKAAISFHSQMMEAHYNEGYLVMELTPPDMAKLATFGFRFERATEFLQQRNEFLTQMQLRAQQRAASGTAAITRDVGVASIPNFACYETVEETFAAAQGFTTTYPSLAAWIDAGNSWEKTQGLGGWDLFVLKLTNKSITGDKPKLFVNSAIHAREYTTAPLNLSFARWLLEGYGTNADATWILDHHEVHLMLQTNPDGRKKAETGLSWRKNTNQAYCGATSNTRGADLNRNFTFQWNSTGGEGSSGAQCDLTYRGPSAGSEPETQAVQAYIRSLWPDRRGSWTERRCAIRHQRHPHRRAQLQPARAVALGHHQHAGAQRHGTSDARAPVRVLQRLHATAVDRPVRHRRHQRRPKLWRAGRGGLHHRAGFGLL